MTAPEGKPVVTAFRSPGVADWRELMAGSAADNDKQEAARKAKDELKNVLLASLQMQHLVVLAGSGCSRSAGGPSMQDLWDGAVARLTSAAVKATAKKVNFALTDRNIEAFLSRVEAFLQVNEDGKVSKCLDLSKQVILDQCSAFR